MERRHRRHRGGPAPGGVGASAVASLTSHMENKTPWQFVWKELSRRIDAWSAAAETLVRLLDHIRSSGNKDAANLALCREANLLVKAIEALELPPDLNAARADVVRTLGSVFSANSGWDGVAHRWVVLAALRAPLDEALGKSDLRNRVDAWSIVRSFISIEP